MELQRLIEAVERGLIPLHDLDPFIPVMGMTKQANDAHMAYRGSLDAAKALHDALLPGWYAMCDTENKAYVSDYARKLFEAQSVTPARAWLLAILKAYQQVQIAT